jgi:hypothetical protein
MKNAMMLTARRFGLLMAVAVTSLVAPGLTLEGTFTGRTWYVKASAEAGGDGSDSAPYATVQEAVDAATTGDTVELAAGEYDAGGRSGSRVVVSKRLHLKGAGRDKTFVVGADDPDGDSDGLGAAAVRCLFFEGDETANSLVEGISLKGGRTSGNGGGAWCDTAETVTNYFVDCTFKDCVSTGDGGAVCGTTVLIRTLVDRCTSVTANRGALYGAVGAYNCVFVASGRYGATKDTTCPVVGVDTYGPFVNCTFVGNEGYAAQKISNWTAIKIYNTLILAHVTVGVEQGAEMAYSATTINGQATNNKHNFGGDWTAGHENERWLSTPFQLVSPLTDWHLRTGSDVIDQGCNDYLEMPFIPVEYRDTDFYGAARVQNSTVDMGASEGGVTPASGILFFQNDANSKQVYVNGRRITLPYFSQSGGSSNNWLYVSASAYPANVTLTAVPTAGGDIFGFQTTYLTYKAANNEHVCRFPGLDGRVHFVLPSGASSVVTNALLLASTVKWVDPVSGVDDASHGTEAAPYRTLQYAVDSFSAQGVIYAKPGEYAEGGAAGKADSDDTTSNITSNRVLISKRLRLVATDGPEKTRIVGKRSQIDTNHDGCGPDAMRCVQVFYSYIQDTFVGIQGFTLTGGATASDPMNNAQTNKTGNAVERGNYGGGAFLCDLWNSNMSHGQLLDCVISNNVAYFGAAVYGGWIQRCVVTGNATVSANKDPLVTNLGGTCLDTVLSASLIYGNNVNKGELYASAHAFDCTVTGSTVLAGSDAASSVLNGKVGSVDAQLRAPDRGDFHPLPGSPALTAGSAASAKFPAYCVGDIDGEPFGFAQGGTFPAGCYAGYATFDDWYADATNGNDANGGTTRAAAKQTLNAALALALPYDTVHAAPGRYADGAAVHPTKIIDDAYGRTIPAVAVIPANVTLVADGDASDTVIVGKLDTETPACSYGGVYLGPGAIRCAVMYTNSTLRGFSLINGGTHYIKNAAQETVVSSDDYYGGGVLAVTGACAADCVISNCQAAIAGGAYRGTYVRCKFLHDAGFEIAGATYEAYHYGCYIDECFDSSVIGAKCLNHTTIGPYCRLWYDKSGTKCGTVFSLASGATMANSLVLSAGKLAKTYDYVYNCRFLSEMESLYTIGEHASGNAFCAAADLAVDAEGRPLAGSNVIDAGDNARLVPGLSAEKDLGGGQRVYNGTVDIGAYEYDCRTDFSRKLLASGKLVVTSADADVTGTVSGVLMRDGSLAVRWNAGNAGCSRHARFRVTGGGTLSVYAEGVLLGTYDSGDGDVSLRIVPASAESLVFAYAKAGSDTDSVGALLSAFEDTNGTVIIFR